jgi:hypothetical protein
MHRQRCPSSGRILRTSTSKKGTYRDVFVENESILKAPPLRHLWHQARILPKQPRNVDCRKKYRKGLQLQGKDNSSAASRIEAYLGNHMLTLCIV